MADDNRVITAEAVRSFPRRSPRRMPPRLLSLDPARLLQARVDGRARVCVRQNYYSVGPLAGRLPASTAVRCPACGGGGTARGGRGDRS
jgi:hypothetical protein